MAKDRSTTEELLLLYNTYLQRPTVADIGKRATIFRSFQRSVGAWLPPDRSCKVLDVGCGEGSFLAFLADRGFTDLAGFDISPENVAICHRLGLTFVQEFNALNVAEYHSGSPFDTVFALDILEHLPKERAGRFLTDLRLTLRVGGYLVIQTPNLGSIFGAFVRYNDLSHEFCVTEQSIVELLLVAGFAASAIEVRPAWNATTWPGYLREAYLRILHRIVFMANDSSRPRIPTKNLLIRARRET